ncbi:hypothetical protein D3C84_945120 [compost metagenome]
MRQIVVKPVCFSYMSRFVPDLCEHAFGFALNSFHNLRFVCCVHFLFLLGVVKEIIEVGGMIKLQYND